MTEDLTMNQSMWITTEEIWGKLDSDTGQAQNNEVSPKSNNHTTKKHHHPDMDFDINVPGLSGKHQYTPM